MSRTYKNTPNMIPTSIISSKILKNYILLTRDSFLIKESKETKFSVWEEGMARRIGIGMKKPIKATSKLLVGFYSLKWLVGRVFIIFLYNLHMAKYSLIYIEYLIIS